MKKRALILIGIMILAAMAFAMVGCGELAEGQTDGDAVSEETEGETAADSEDGEEEDSGAREDINLRDIYGGGSNYLFTYKGEDYSAVYYYDNWCIYDSYKITSGRAMKKICQALIDEHPVHGSDYESFRTADDMVYEWKQHNIAYAVLPDDNPWKQTTGNVDFDPEDQGKSVEELYESRTGEEFDLADHKDDIKRYLENILQ